MGDSATVYLLYVVLSVFSASLNHRSKELRLADKVYLIKWPMCLAYYRD